MGRKGLSERKWEQEYKNFRAYFLKIFSTSKNSAFCWGAGSPHTSLWENSSYSNHNVQYVGVFRERVSPDADTARQLECCEDGVKVEVIWILMKEHQRLQ